METGGQSNEITRLKETGMVKVECQKRTLLVLQASQDIKPI
jgi:hypothetical protein